MAENYEVVGNEPKTNGLGIASMVIGILSIIGTCCYGWILGIIGLILGIVGVCLRGYGKGMAIAGIILNLIAIILFVVVVLILGVSSMAEMNQYSMLLF